MIKIFELLFTWLVEFYYTNEGEKQVIRSTTKGIDIVVVCERDIQVYLDGEILPYKEYNKESRRYWKVIEEDRIKKMEDYLNNRLNPNL